MNFEKGDRPYYNVSAFSYFHVRGWKDQWWWGSGPPGLKRFGLYSLPNNSFLLMISFNTVFALSRNACFWFLLGTDEEIGLASWQTNMDVKRRTRHKCFKLAIENDFRISKTRESGAEILSCDSWNIYRLIKLSFCYEFLFETCNIWSNSIHRDDGKLVPSDI